MSHPVTCVIVEDEVRYQEILQFYLTKLPNIKITGVFGDTVSASLGIERLKPDLVFLDINISGLDGPEFISLLEHRSKVIVVSGHDETYLNENYDLEYFAFIQKPIDQEKLKRALASL